MNDESRPKAALESTGVPARTGVESTAPAENGSPLRRAITAADASLKSLTVLATQNDPFRVDTPARHRDGAWLAITARDLGLGDRKIHPRGLHYMVIGRPKPNGQPYANTEADWLWLAGDACKAARWLGYMDFDQIEDHRNTAPTIKVSHQRDPYPYISVGIHVDIPAADEIVPTIGVLDFDGVQPFKLALFGEKSSLSDVLVPVADRYGADWYQPAGEISDTMLHTMASTAATDGRPLVVLTFSDCDPAGWQMPISISRKLQAFKAALFPELEFEVHRVALGPDQVRQYGLPSTPLKATERRADKWMQSMGTAQTEIDALASLRPDLLREIAMDALDPFYDHTLARRVNAAERQWQEDAQAALDEQMDSGRMAQIRADAASKLDAMRAEIATLNEALQLDTDDFMVPTPEIPTAEINGVHGSPLVDSRWSFAEQCRRLIASKSYDGGGADE